ncbi:MAG: hypothetical protein HND58_09620 [Planctomycetota bacterium]|nr:MAG: hypothetical protein HND58_09620 [Planctomycetota bacterium]
MREEDARKIIEFARGRFKSLSPTPPKVWDAAPPVWVIDCVLSLNRRYKEVVAPPRRRVRGRQPRHQDLRAVALDDPGV